MATPLIGNLSLGNLSVSISHRSLRGIVNGNSQKLLNNISTNVNLGSGNYTYKWNYIGNSINFSNLNSSSTNCSYNSLSRSAASSIYCTITDNNTGLEVTTENCDITWPIHVTTPITSVTWSTPSDTNSTYNGNPQSVTVVSVTPADAVYTLTTTSATNAGTIASTTLSGIENFSGTFTSPTVTINKAPITIKSDDTSMNYGSSLPSFGYTPSGFLGSDTASVITGTVTHSTTGSSTANTGSYTIIPNISGLSTTNYTFSASNGTLTINKAVITITSANASMTYRGSLPAFGYTPSGFLGSDNASVITGTVTHSTTGSSTSNAGTYTITPSISGLSATNYTFSASNGTLIINKAVITITSSNASMTYGSSLPSFGYTPSGFLGPDNASVITGTVSHSTTGSSSANAGSYSITPDISNLIADNYTFSASNGTLTINAAALSASTTTGSATYNGASQSITVLSGINGTYTGSTSVSGTNAGSYTTTITGTGNYTGTVTGTLNIGPAALTASTTTGSTTFNGDIQTVNVISGINGTFSGSATTSGTNAGTYSTTITGTGNYSGTVNGTLTISPSTITLQGTGESRTYNGTTQSVGYTVGGSARNNYSYIISGTSGINAGTYTATITSTTSNYVVHPTINSFTWTIHPAPASSSPASGTTIYQVYDGTTKSATVISGLSGLSYSSSPIASGVNAGTYPTTITLGGNYSGNVTGYLVISQAFGDISLYFGGYVAAGDTNTKLFSSYLQRANASYTWSASVSGPGAGDAYLQPGYGVESRSFATAGFVVTITATISDPNYSASSATTSITFEAYVPPPSGDGGFVYE